MLEKLNVLHFVTFSVVPDPLKKVDGGPVVVMECIHFECQIFVESLRGSILALGGERSDEQ